MQGVVHSQKLNGIFHSKLSVSTDVSKITLPYFCLFTEEQRNQLVFISVINVIELDFPTLFLIIRKKMIHSLRKK